MKKIISLTITFLLTVSTITFADTNTYKLTIKAENASILEQDNIDYIEVLLQEADNTIVIYLEKAKNWVATQELKSGEYKIKVTNISLTKYLVKNDYSVNLNEDKTSVIKLDNFEVDNKKETKESEKTIIASDKEVDKSVKEKQQVKTNNKQSATKNLKNRLKSIIKSVLIGIIAIVITWILLYFFKLFLNK